MHSFEVTSRSRSRVVPPAVNHRLARPSPGIQEGPAANILAIQRAIGNQAVQRLLRSEVIQPKLSVGAPGDVYEQEADRVAQQVMQMPAPIGSSAPAEGQPPQGIRVQRVCSKCEEEVHREVAVGEQQATQFGEVTREPAELSSPLEARILGQRGGGDPLPPSVRGFFEPRFGRDFGHVRIHADENAARSARAVQARAYTFGHDIVFDTGEYAPDTAKGQTLLAHELTHVIQQRPAEGHPAPEGAKPLSVSGRVDAGPYVARWPPCPSTTNPSRCSGRCGTGGVCSFTYGSCKCLGSSTIELPAWLILLLSAAALALIYACFASGVCEAAALVAVVGIGLFLVVAGVLRAFGVTVDGGATAATAASTDTTADSGQGQGYVASQDSGGAASSDSSAQSDQQDNASA